MNATMNKAPERHEIEELLPWHAAGTLSRRDAQRVEAALEQDSELADRYALAREELSGTIHLNETLGAPSARAMERLLAGIEAESGPAQPRRSTASLGASFGAWLAERMSLFSTRTLGFAAVAGALVIVLQAGLLGSMLVGGGMHDAFQSTRSVTASKSPGVTRADPGSFALMGFRPDATAAEVTQFLEKNQFAIVDGPRANGLYRVRIWVASVPKEEAVRIISRVREQAGIVRFIAATE